MDYIIKHYLKQFFILLSLLVTIYSGIKFHKSTTVICNGNGPVYKSYQDCKNNVTMVISLTTY